MEDDFMGAEDNFGSADRESMLPDLTIRPGMSEKDIKRINDMKAQLQTEMELIGDMMGHSTIKPIKPTETKVESKVESKTGSGSESKPSVQTKAKPIQTKPIQTKPIQTKPVQTKSKSKPAQKSCSDNYNYEHDYDDYDDYAEYDGLYKD